MAQLTDDCFAFSGPLMRLEEMERLIAERIAPVAGLERVPLAEAHGRVVAQDVIAPVSLPPFDNSAVDGYAVRHADLQQGETRLRISGRLQAGAPVDAAVESGEAIRIFTGAAMPTGADTVFMQEDARVEGDVLIVPPGLKRGANRRFAGEDLQTGSVALSAGTVLGPQHVALAAGLGLTELPMRRRLKVAIFSTGDEVVEPGRPLPPAAIYDANRYLLRDLLTRFGAQVSDLGILADDPEPLAAALRDAADAHDLILTSGGVSTGEADFVRNAVERAGNLVFWRIAIKPGRPVAMGVIRGKGGSSAAFVGLPGNPVAAFVTFVKVVQVLLRRLAGAQPQALTPLPVRAAFPYRKKKDRREFVRVSLVRAGDGELEAHKHPQDGAGVITSLTATDGLLELPEDVTCVAPGDRVGFLPYAVLVG